jgi:hypothetical protein
VLLAEKPGEQVGVVAERLLCEAFDSRPKHVAVNCGPVDPTERRAGVVPTWAKLVRTFAVDRGECMADVFG